MIYVKSKSVVLSRVGDQTTVLDTANGEYFVINETGAAVMDVLGTPTDIDGIVENFEGDTAIRDEVTSFLEQLVELGLVEAHGDA